MPAIPASNQQNRPGGCDMQDTVKIYTDGSCSGNPGPGGFAALIQYGEDLDLLVTGGAPGTTNNRMELAALIEAVKAVNKAEGLRNHHLTVRSDATYLVNAFNHDWIGGWVNRGWLNAKGQAVANRDLWETLIQELKGHPTTFIWIRGHSGHPQNEYCDRVAVAQANEARGRNAYWSTTTNRNRTNPTEAEGVWPTGHAPAHHAAEAAKAVETAISLQRSGNLSQAMSLLKNAQQHLSELRTLLPQGDERT